MYTGEHIFLEKLYDLDEGKPDVDKEVFIELAKLACCNIIMSTPKGYYEQQDGLGMGIQPAPQLANVWLSQFEDEIKEDADIFDRYVDDIILDIEEEKPP